MSLTVPVTLPVRSPAKFVLAVITVPLIVVNTPVDAVVAPIAVPSIVPPLISTVANVDVPVDVTSPVKSPVTLPVTLPVKSPVTSPVTSPIRSVSSVLFITNLSPVAAYVNVASAPSIVIPEPFAAAASAAPFANTIFRSSTVNVAVFNVVVVPFTVKFPDTIKLSSTVTSVPAPVAVIVSVKILSVAVTVLNVTS